MGKTALIIEREYLTRVNKKSFILMTLLTPLIFIAIIGVTLLMSRVKDSEAKVIAVVDNTGLYEDVLKGTEEYNFIYTAGINPNDTSNSIASQYYAILTIDKNLIEDPSGLSLVSEKTITPALKKEIGSQMNPWLSEQKIASFNIPELKKIIRDSDVKIDINTIKVENDGTQTNNSAEAASIMGMMMTVIIYMFIFAYGAMVLNGVVQEKTSRIIEVMVSSVKPFQLMMGKIIAVALVGLTQFLIWILFGLGAFMTIGIVSGFSASPDELKQISEAMNAGNQGVSMMQHNPMMNDINEMFSGINFTQMISLFILYFIGGYLLYASLFAAIGSLVDQEADTQQFMLPVTVIMMFALYSAMYSVENPDGPLAFWGSMIPFTSPIVMMVRLPYDVPFWQIALSLGILFATFILTTKLAAKIYRTGILMYGKKISYKEVAKWFKYKY